MPIEFSDLLRHSSGLGIEDVGRVTFAKAIWRGPPAVRTGLPLPPRSWQYAVPCDGTSPP
jgi:hypothetical protein